MNANNGMESKTRLVAVPMGAAVHVMDVDRGVLYSSLQLVQLQKLGYNGVVRALVRGSVPVWEGSRLEALAVEARLGVQVVV